jgi:hypothetical protein
MFDKKDRDFRKPSESLSFSFSFLSPSVEKGGIEEMYLLRSETFAFVWTLPPLRIIQAKYRQQRPKEIHFWHSGICKTSSFLAFRHLQDFFISGIPAKSRQYAVPLFRPILDFPYCIVQIITPSINLNGEILNSAFPNPHSIVCFAHIDSKSFPLLCGCSHFHYTIKRR